MFIGDVLADNNKIWIHTRDGTIRAVNTLWKYYPPELTKTLIRHGLLFIAI
jgi:hypothetical protein